MQIQNNAQNNLIKRNYADSISYLKAEHNLIIQDTISKVKKPLQDSIIKVWQHNMLKPIGVKVN